MKLNKHTVLQRAPDLTIELSAITDVELILEGDSFFIAAHARRRIHLRDGRVVADEG